MATREERLLRNAQIIELRKQKKSQKQIAEELNLSETLVGSVLRSSGHGGVVEGFDYHHPCTEEQEEKRAEALRRRYKENEKDRGKEFFKKYVDCGKYDFIDYLSCVDDKEGTITLKCKMCGNVLTRSLTTVRHGRFHCDECARIDAEKRKQIEAEEKRYRKEQKHKQTIEAREADRLARTRLVKCQGCGMMFLSIRSNARTCSKECQRVYSNSLATRRKDARITKEKRIDKGISALSLYRRDNGTCWICGEQCDTNDFTNKNGTIICGNRYPSVDHVVPIVYGGEDSWENVKLAHRICNSMRFFREKIAPCRENF